jgi:hypothetical protein
MKSGNGPAILYLILIFGSKLCTLLLGMEIEILQPRHESTISIRAGDDVVLMLGIEDSDQSSKIQIMVNGRAIIEASPGTDGVCGPEDFCTISILLPSATLGTGLISIEALAIKNGEEVIAVSEISLSVIYNNASTSCRCTVSTCSCQLHYVDLIKRRMFLCDEMMNCSLR